MKKKILLINSNDLDSEEIYKEVKKLTKTPWYEKVFFLRIIDVFKSNRNAFGVSLFISFFSLALSEDIYWSTWLGIFIFVTAHYFQKKLSEKSFDSNTNKEDIQIHLLSSLLISSFVTLLITGMLNVVYPYDYCDESFFLYSERKCAIQKVNEKFPIDYYFSE